MRLATRILFALSGFLLLAAAVYWTMSYTGTAQNRDPAGPALLAVAAVGFGYTGLVLWAAARRADREAAAEHAAPGAEHATVAHVPPTIWPFGFSSAAPLATDPVASRRARQCPLRSRNTTSAATPTSTASITVPWYWLGLGAGRPAGLQRRHTDWPHATRVPQRRQRS
jgi:hypothetical protein